MTNRTFWDEEFKELSSIELSENQKIKLWKNITAKKKKNQFGFFKNGILLIAAISLFMILTESFLSGRINTQNHSASLPQKQVKIAPSDLQQKTDSVQVQPKTYPSQVQQLAKEDTIGWEQISRLRYDLGVIENIQIDQKEVSITVKRIQSFGTDPDPLGPVMKPDTDKRTYILITSEHKQTLSLKTKQKVLLAFAQYTKKGSTDWVWAAEVLGNTLKDDKFYNSDDAPINLNISSKVNIKDGILKIEP